MKILAAIPSRNNYVGLKNILAHCLAAEHQVNKVVVYDNGYENKSLVKELKFFDLHIDATGWPFYRMWNEAWKMSFLEGFDAVALINDDIELPLNGLSIASTRFEEDPSIGIIGLDYNRRVKDGLDIGPPRTVSGSARLGGIGGHAFILRSSLWGKMEPIDESYFLWYGDDELFGNVERAGYRLEIATGIPVDHEQSTTSLKYPELMEKTSIDKEKYYSKWDY